MRLLLSLLNYFSNLYGDRLRLKSRTISVGLSFETFLLAMLVVVIQSPGTTVRAVLKILPQRLKEQVVELVPRIFTMTL